MEEVGPGFVGQFEIIDIVLGEQAAVVFGDVVGSLPTSIKRKRFLKFCQRGFVTSWNPETVRPLGMVLLGQQLPVFAKGDEHDAVEQPLGHFDGGIGNVAERLKMLDKLRAGIRVKLVKFVADRGLLLAGFGEQAFGQRGAFDQSFAAQQNIEPLEFVAIAEVLQRKVLVFAGEWNCARTIGS